MSEASSRRMTRFFVWAGLVAAVVAGVFALNYWLEADHLVDHGRVTEGRLVEEGRGGEGGSPAVIEFVHPTTGRKVTFEAGVGGVLGGGSNEVGASVAIRYDPDDPTVYGIDSNFHTWGYFAMALTAAVVLGIWSIGAALSLRYGLRWPGVG